MSDWAACVVAALSTVQVLVLAYIARDALKSTVSSRVDRSSTRSIPAKR